LFEILSRRWLKLAYASGLNIDKILLRGAIASFVIHPNGILLQYAPGVDVKPLYASAMNIVEAWFQEWSGA